MHIAQSKSKFSAVITSIPQIGQKGSAISGFFRFFGEKRELYAKLGNCSLRKKIHTKFAFLIANFPGRCYNFESRWGRILSICVPK
jgi:hypothetical protein